MFTQNPLIVVKMLTGEQNIQFFHPTSTHTQTCVTLKLAMKMTNIWLTFWKFIGSTVLLSLAASVLIT